MKCPMCKGSKIIGTKPKWKKILTLLGFLCGFLPGIILYFGWARESGYTCAECGLTWK